MPTTSITRRFAYLLLAGLPLAGTGCPVDEPVRLAEGVFATPGEIMPAATEEQRATFERGKAVALRRFVVSEGLGPILNVSACADCHERPVIGAGSPRYRDFLLAGQALQDGSFLPVGKGGVVTSHGVDTSRARPALGETTNVLAHRHPIPFFGVGLIAELPEDAILVHADPDDSDGDGISGRPNYDQGFVGRFGRKSQTVSIEGFIRGPLNNHLGITTDPLTDEQKNRLPVPSGSEAGGGFTQSAKGLDFRQAAAPASPLTDEDAIQDPEMPGEDLFDLIAFSMLLAAPEPEPLNEVTTRGLETFRVIGCDDCHVERLNGPRGALPIYSDLLLHDMGPALADGIEQGLAEGSEFRTQPLWGVAAFGPYLHDGRADTLADAILLHGGEGQASRDRFAELDDVARDELLEFLTSLGGRELIRPGRLAPDEPVPAVNTLGGPRRALSETELARFDAGRRRYDRDITLADGLGPTFNGDSCRACHKDPVFGGAGPLDLDVLRYGHVEGGSFSPPSTGTMLHRLATWDADRPEPEPGNEFFEARQTPTNLGLGELESIPDDVILALADPTDADGDGIAGYAHVFDDGRLGRFGWKAQVPSLAEFVRDGLSNELGVTVPAADGMTFGNLSDGDDVADPEIGQAAMDELEFFLQELAPPQPLPGGTQDSEGFAVFEELGCASCHVPELPGTNGPVRAYTDLLLHRILADGAGGVLDGLADELSFRTPPLWGLRDTAPYMHDGAAETIEQAIAAHAGEGSAARDAFEGASAADREALLAFLAAL